MTACSWLAVAIPLLAACGSSDDDANWMAKLDDARSIAELSIPGTHDSGARFEPYAGIAKCQNLTLAEQLAAGVRYFDLRCRHVSDQFLIYHGSIDQNQTFDEALATLYAFLDAHPGEVILASVKEEALSNSTTRSFEDTFGAYVAQQPERWVLAPTLPVLGDVRGKLVLLRRFPATHTPLGIDATQWPDNTTFTIDDPDARLHVEDAYMVTDNDAKWAAITDNFTAAAAGDAATWMLTYTSGYQTISALPNIPIVADDINTRLDMLLAEPGKAHAHLGTLVMDLVTPTRVNAIIRLNSL